MKKKIALIFGITGQDGSYLSEFLLKKKYIVHGIIRRSSSFNTGRIDHLYQDPHIKNRNFILHYGDITDALSVNSLISKIKPDEIYNLAAQSHVAVSFEVPEYTASADAIGALRILEAIKFHKLGKKTKFYQAGTSEMFGKVKEIPQNEKTPFYPRSPYGVAKVYAHWITVNYREAYNLFACNGILFNHESPVRGETFVTRKITDGVARINAGQGNCLELGNLDASRDWGYAPEFVDGMYRMMQHDTSDNFVLATNRAVTVKRFTELAFEVIGTEIIWEGAGVKEKGIDKKTGKEIVRISEKYFRLAEVDALIGNPAKAEKLLGWKPKTTIEQLCQIMVESDIIGLKNNSKR